MTDDLDYEGNPGEHIAIIGMTGRFPGARNTDEFWKNLRDGVESITFFTADELAESDLDKSLLGNTRYVGADGIIEDMDMFDAEFFNIPPREAELLDPQHRLFLECAWELMEQAGYDSEHYPGRVAVYGSANLSTYLIRNVMTNPDTRETASSFQTMLANDKDFVATRVSYKMNLKGPSLSVATLCSSGALAIHMGCQALLNYQSDLAMAGAVSLQVSRNETFFYQEGGIGDPDGHCRAFDAKASGTVSGSGVSLVALKRLEDALNEGDNILAVLRATAVNNDGSIKYSFTAPSVEGQAEVIAEAIALADIDPETITYVETHGTGTRLGDPIEVTALTQAFRGNGAEANQFCAIGSVKTNIGHLVNAGGVASLIKTVLAMQHEQIPPSLHYETPNPEIDFPNSPFYVATKLINWNPNGFPRRAGVSSFGIGGTNVHMIVEQAPKVQPSGKARAQQLLVLSAKTATALQKQTENLVEYLQNNPNANLADVAFTLQIGRHSFAHRRALLCSSVPEAITALTANDPASTSFQQSKNRPVAFMFSGSAEKLINAGVELYQNEVTFREQVDACAKAAQPLLNLDLRKIIYPAATAVEQATQTLKQAPVAQAALFTWEYALAKLWQEWGIEAQGMVGDGVGELVAACLANAITLETALGLIAGKPLEAEDLQEPEIRWVSWTTKTWITEKEAADPLYWNRLLTQPGSFSRLVAPLLKESEQILLEIGPDESLSKLVQAHAAKNEQQIVLSSFDPAAQTGFGIFSTLRQLWLAGASITWSGFHAHEKRHRLPLPTYPFERKRYWLEPNNMAVQPAAKNIQQALNTKNKNIANWLYIPSWKRSLLARPAASTPACGWLVLADEGGFAEALTEKLTAAGQQVYSVKPASTQKADFDALLRPLQDKNIQHIVHLSSLGETPSAGFASLIGLAQSLGETPLAEKISLTVFSHGLHEVSQQDALSPEKSALLGAVKVIPQENSSIQCRNIDLDAAQPSPKQIARLFAELTANAQDAIVAYRGTHRWVQTYEPVHLDETPLQQGGRYLFVGGAEGIAPILAKHLTEKYSANCQIVASPAQISSLSGINGLIYTPASFGKAQFVTLGEIKTDESVNQLAKINADLQALLQVTANAELDFCLVTSSLSAILGGLGLAEYTALNSYIDAFVKQQNRNTQTTWVSVNWDSWKLAESTPLSERMDALAITPEEGALTFERILAAADIVNQLIVSTVDLNARLQQWVAHEVGPQAEKKVIYHSRPNLVTVYVAPSNEIEQKIAEIWQTLLGIEAVGIHDNFFELGGDSLMAVQIISRMRAALGIDLPLTNLFEQPTIAFLAEYVATVRWALQNPAEKAQEEGRQEFTL